MRERAEPREGLPGKVGKFETLNKQVEKVVTHEQTKAEKIVTRARRVGGVLWRHQSHVATRRSHMRKSYMAKQSHSVQDEMRTEPCCTCDRRLECEIKSLNHEHVCSLSSLETRHSDSGHCIHG